MGKGMIVFAGLFGMGVISVLVMVMIVIGMNNTAVRMEAGVTAQFDQNQNTRSKMVNSIAEAVQVPEMYKDDFKEVLTAAVEGTYGKGGSKAVMQWITERQINFDSGLYAKIQTMIESNRAEFALEQKKLIDKKRQYFDVQLKVFPASMVYGFLGFPKINEDEFKVIVSQDNAQVFAEGKEGPMKLR